MFRLQHDSTAQSNGCDLEDCLTTEVGKEGWDDITSTIQKSTEWEIRTARYTHFTINEDRIVNTEINFLKSFWSYERG